MIVLSIVLHHLAYKRRVAPAVVQPINNLLPMVPDLVILLEAQAHGAQPLQVLLEVAVVGEQHLRAVQPQV